MILPLEKQVTSLELSKRLEKLGVPQDGALFYYGKKDGWPALLSAHFYDLGPMLGFKMEKEVAAFTVAEMGEMLPPDTSSSRNDNGTYSCCTLVSEDGDETFWDAKEDFDPQVFNGETEADARAKMLIHLIEKGLVKP